MTFSWNPFVTAVLSSCGRLVKVPAATVQRRVIKRKAVVYFTIFDHCFRKIYLLVFSNDLDSTVTLNI
jgi:hypothetical protein